MILALETATPVCSVVLEDDSGRRIEERTDTPRSHSKELFLFIQKLMEKHQFTVNDLSAVLVSKGPGSYTGLRIAASGVKGLLFDTNVPLYSVSTLASLAVSAQQQEPSASTIHAILDARRVHLYHQQFSASEGIVQPVTDTDIIPIESFKKMIEAGDVIIGTGFERIDEHSRSKARCFGTNFITAESLIDIYHQQESDEFIQEIAPPEFDPNYFTSTQG